MQESGYVQVVQYHWTETAQSLLIPAEPPPGQTGAHSCGLSHSSLLLLQSSRDQRLYLYTMLLCITKMHAQITQSSIKKKRGGVRKSDLFYVCEDLHREEIKRNIYGSLILGRKASEKSHDCKLKPEKFQLEMKSNFNHNNHPLSSLKKERIVLTKPRCIRSKKVFLWIHSSFLLLLMRKVP